MEKKIFHHIREIVMQIPEGRVATYGQVASLTGRCTARMVGYAMAALPDNSPVPWHRVINSHGRISPRGIGFGGILQKQMLEDEGVLFDPYGRIDLEQYGWFFPPSVTG